ncbi:MAG: HDOD domain-containing protein [Candidatus Thiodiazotropha sp.]|nr:HDOD domain-containing protein [Candidatus Thiodiazotropha taylori]MBT3062416.1 HDOD domain-containing protein [Candidatus Thiodiazotropha sp. (ex Lucina pensylvanica)]MBV2095525.1 HDOD domain-containing protein [Candidatus Thiodiazotropha sp. (ex Codakia orbicularis)]PUB73881.1 MAG: histidine kinase [gamma proteobacterium symbiont of Ctena orbiculata]PUB73976.1 MAG: histidine kinase [gamma proteobacterium symbiont of Ctena orbiculata]
MIQRLTAVSSNDVKKIPLLRYLPKRVLEYVLSETHVEHQNAGVGIVANGEGTDRVYFLLQGEVELISADGTRRHLQSDQPISPLLAENSPNDAAINSLTAVDLLTLPRELYNAIKGLPPVANARSNQTIELNDAEGPEDSLYWEFYEAIKNDTLELPSMPDITLRIAKVINDSNTDSEEIARVVQADPTVAARIISVVNSAAYRGKQQIETLPDAVTRLGRSVTHNLVISFALGKLFNSRSKVLKRRMIDLWKHVSYVAPICHELAQVTPGLENDQALLCGLLHDIGALAILGAATSKPELAENPELLDRIIENLKGEVGAMVLRKWEFPDYFVQAALHAEDWMEDISHEADYVDLVVVAQLHAYVGTPKMHSLPRLDLVPAFHKLALGKLTPRHSIGIIDNAKDQIRELRELLAI